MMRYIGSELIDGDISDAEVDRLIGRLKKNGYRYGAEKVCGYEAGILLTLAVRCHPKAVIPLRRAVLSMRDGAGAWSEYYVNHTQSGSLYRPWESGINGAALLTTEESYGDSTVDSAVG